MKPASIERYSDTLQANILKSVGQSHQLVGLYKFDDISSEKTRQVIKDIEFSSFDDQMNALELHRKEQASSTFCLIYLSASGYKSLGYSETSLPKDPAFREGMKQRANHLGDEDSSKWNAAYDQRMDACIYISGPDKATVTQHFERVNARLTGLANAKLLTTEKGETVRTSGGVKGHFGFVDGISNPVFTQEDQQKAVENNRSSNLANPDIALASDPLAPGTLGSYVVLRKIKQNVEEFENSVTRIARKLATDDRDHVKAQFIGRFPDGTPLVNGQIQAGTSDNDFDFVYDPKGSGCPFHSHIRKMNDRGDGLLKGDWVAASKKRRIVRRGFTYTDAEDDKGLIFLCYQSSIVNQFEALQSSFANNQDYFQPHTGTDPIIGTKSPDSAGQKWHKPGNPTETIRDTVSKLTELVGGEYFFAPSTKFLSEMPEPDSHKNDRILKRRGSTARVAGLREELINRAFGNRETQWFKQEDLGSVLDDKTLVKAPLIVRKAHACRKMLEAMTDKDLSLRTKTFEILEGEILAGRPPMGSVGLGKLFPEYLTDEERRLSSVCNRDEPSVFGHTVPNFERILQKGLGFYVKEARVRSKNKKLYSGPQRDFYEACAISCQSVIDYAAAFSKKAERLAGVTQDEKRRAELLEMSRVCKTVPANPANNFHEAIQSIWFLHVAQTAFCALNSLGRLDQVLYKYWKKDSEKDQARALELIENFMLLGAERINLDPSTLIKQDNLSFGTGIGTQPIYLDQVASSNNFIQNIVIGGSDANGRDLSNRITTLFLKANGNLGLCTPTLNIRLHKNTPDDLYKELDQSLRDARSGLPILFNDETVVKGLIASGVPRKLAYDYACAGCWEPVLNGQCSFIFGMVNMPKVFESALNSGRLLTNATMFLKGRKLGPRTADFNAITSFSQFQDIFRQHLQFYTDKVALSTCNYFLLPGKITPTPFLSVLLDGCFERGIDQSLGGADHNIAGCLAFGMPNVINALQNIKQKVFEEEEWTLEQVCEAMRWNWGAGNNRSEYEVIGEPDEDRISRMQKIRRTFLSSPKKWASGDMDVNRLGQWLMDEWHKACEGSAALAKKAFLPVSENTKAQTMRAMTNYQGPSLNHCGGRAPDDKVKVHFTSGSGTFGQYSSMGIGVTASADGRASNDPIAPNFSPPGGTSDGNLESLFNALSMLENERFGCGVMTDIGVDGVLMPQAFFADLARNWTGSGGSILTVSVLPDATKNFLLEKCDRVRAGLETVGSLRPFADQFCRVGGWNSAFICLPQGQQRDHVLRSIE